MSVYRLVLAYGEQVGVAAAVNGFSAHSGAHRFPK